jgi:hypothetical protein
MKIFDIVKNAKIKDVALYDSLGRQICTEYRIALSNDEQRMILEANNCEIAETAEANNETMEAVAEEGDNLHPILNRKPNGDFSVRLSSTDFARLCNR